MIFFIDSLFCHLDPLCICFTSLSVVPVPIIYFIAYPETWRQKCHDHQHQHLLCHDEDDEAEVCRKREEYQKIKQEKARALNLHPANSSGTRKSACYYSRQTAKSVKLHGLKLTQLYMMITSIEFHLLYSL